MKNLGLERSEIELGFVLGLSFGFGVCFLRLRVHGAKCEGRRTLSLSRGFFLLLFFRFLFWSFCSA
jgi:hypothetical protein